MIRSILSKVGGHVSSKVIGIVIVIVALTSCSSYDLEITSHPQEQQLHEVTVTLTGIGFTIESATRATASEAEITRITFKVFNEDGDEVASVSQIASEAGDSFNKLKIQLPADTYTFVAVAHDASADNISCATIESSEVVTLPEAIIPTLYAHVQTVTLANANNQTINIDMGDRINATLHLTSTDIVPEGVSLMAIDLNPTGKKIGASNLPKFNPATGCSIDQYRFSRALPVTAGDPIGVSMNLLLPEDEFSFPAKIYAQNASNESINDYTRSFDAVPFQRAYITNANGQYFRYVNSISMTFDTTNETKDYPF